MRQRKKNFNKARQVAFLGLLFALAMALSFAESLIPALPMLPPGVKLGLSNIVTMYTLYCLGAGYAAAVGAMKGFFVFLTRGAVASVLSLSGSLFSIVVMLLLLGMKKLRFSPYFVSIFGAVFHNVGQLTAASFLLKSAMVFGYLPVLILSGVVMGLLTGALLKAVQPYFDRLNHPNRPEREKRAAPHEDRQGEENGSG